MIEKNVDKISDEEFERIFGMSKEAMANYLTLTVKKKTYNINDLKKQVALIECLINDRKSGMSKMELCLEYHISLNTLEKILKENI